MFQAGCSAAIHLVPCIGGRPMPVRLPLALTPAPVHFGTLRCRSARFPEQGKHVLPRWPQAGRLGRRLMQGDSCTAQC
eukprot:15485212-Alexandrium_andersonii.AAC.1